MESFNTLSLFPAEFKLPVMAKVKVSTDENFKENLDVNLEKLTLGPGQALLLHFSNSA